MINELLKKTRRVFGKRIYENVNNTNFDKNCLLTYIVSPFKPNATLTNHQNQWQVKELARIIGEFDYNVDVINYDETVRLTKIYDLVIDLHPGLNRTYQDHLSASSLKVAYITSANPTFSNDAEASRLEQLFKRRGVKLKQRRYVPPFDKEEIESFDAMFFIGNQYNVKTYQDFNLKKIFFIKNTGYKFLSNDNFRKKSPLSFLFLGSKGQVLRGLDLLLEVFSRNRHLNLYVCGFFRSEKDFCRLYRRELFDSKNIFPVGLIDITTKRFGQIASLCSYAILPSAAEGISGSVLTAMSAGLIPIISRECGIEEGEAFFLPDCSVETISDAVNFYSKKDLDWISQESIRAMRIVSAKYSETAYSDSVRRALKGLLS